MPKKAKEVAEWEGDDEPPTGKKSETIQHMSRKQKD